MTELEKVIKGLEFTKAMITFNPLTGEDIEPENLNEEDKTTYDACVGAIALLKEQKWHLLTEDDNGIIHGLPGDDGQYFMTDGKEIWIDDYVDGVDDGVWLDSGRDIREIKAWMYKPGLPK